MNSSIILTNPVVHPEVKKPGVFFHVQSGGTIKVPIFTSRIFCFEQKNRDKRDRSFRAIFAQAHDPAADAAFRATLSAWEDSIYEQITTQWESDKICQDYNSKNKLIKGSFFRVYKTKKNIPIELYSKKSAPKGQSQYIPTEFILNPQDQQKKTSVFDLEGVTGDLLLHVKVSSVFVYEKMVALGDGRAITELTYNLKFHMDSSIGLFKPHKDQALANIVTDTLELFGPPEDEKPVEEKPPTPTSDDLFNDSLDELFLKDESES